MTIPNLANINSIFFNSYFANLTSNSTSILTNPLYSNVLIRINSILLNNYSDNLNSNVTLQYNQYGSSANIFLSSKFQVPAFSQAYFLNKHYNLVLEEGDSIQANTDILNTNVSITVGYELISELTDYLRDYSSGIDYLVVGGGGSGGDSSQGSFGGGGGGGGFRLGTLTSTSLNLGESIPIVVGAGGTNAIGSNSCFGNFINSSGGGCGAGDGGSATAGGSGGGGSPAGAGNSGGYTPSEGNPGGGVSNGGGGGACQAGLSNGQGGNGCYTNITGVMTAYAGGGGGGTGPGIAGGLGGGGPGSAVGLYGGGSGETNSGGGGGGGTDLFTNNGPGGSGVVIVRISSLKGGADVDTTGTVETIKNSWYTIYKFTGSGSITFNNF